MGFSTTAIHAGQEPDPATGAVTVPIYQTSTYAQEGLGKHKGFEYARTQNPTRFALERNIAALEGARFGYAFASGMAAIDSVLRLVRAGEHVIVSDNTYGGTFRLFTRILTNYGIEFSFVDTSDAENVEAALKENTRMVFLETPTNPVMIVTDLQAVSDVAHARGVRVVCDNTFMSPYLQRPIEFGVDIVVHSTTKMGAGTAGTFTGTARAVKKINPKAFCVLVEPEGSIFGGGAPGDHKVEGIGQSQFIPSNFDCRVADEVMMITDKEAFATVRKLAEKEGVLCGGSGGAAAAAARRVAERLGEGKRIITLLPDGAERYMSQGIFDEC